MGTGDATPAGNYEIASAALGLLTPTYHDDNHFGPITMDYLTAIGSDATKVLLPGGFDSKRDTAGVLDAIAGARCYRAGALS